MVQLIGLIVAAYVLPRLWEIVLPEGTPKPRCLRGFSAVMFWAVALLTLALLFSGT